MSVHKVEDNLTIEALKKDKQELEKQMIAVNGALMYISQKITLLENPSVEEVTPNES